MHVSTQSGDSETLGSDVRRMSGRVKGRSAPRLARAEKNNPEAGASSRHLGAPPGIRRFPALLQGLGRREGGKPHVHLSTSARPWPSSAGRPRSRLQRMQQIQRSNPPPSESDRGEWFFELGLMTSPGSCPLPPLPRTRRLPPRPRPGGEATVPQRFSSNQNRRLEH